MTTAELVQALELERMRPVPPRPERTVPTSDRRMTLAQATGARVSAEQPSAQALSSQDRPETPSSAQTTEPHR